MKSLREFIGTARYDSDGTIIWGVNEQAGHQMIGEVRGWGAIQNLFKDDKGVIDEAKAEAFQDEMGQFFADAINEKLSKAAPKKELSSLAQDEVLCRMIAEMLGWDRLKLVSLQDHEGDDEVWLSGNTGEANLYITAKGEVDYSIYIKGEKHTEIPNCLQIAQLLLENNYKIA